MVLWRIVCFKGISRVYIIFPIPEFCIKGLCMKYLKACFFIVFLFFSSAYAQPEEEYQFTGEHLLASYMECDPKALLDPENLFSAMKSAVTKAGATFLDFSEVHFQPSGYTLVILLSESHASIHTYPEHGACFVDFFTCGTSCSSKIFHEEIQKTLCPKKVVAKTFSRGDVIEEIR